MKEHFWIDTHAHLYAAEFDPDRDEMMQRARAQNIRAVILPNIDPHSVEKMHRLEEESGGVCHACMGLHPCSVNADYKQALKLAEQWLGRRSYVAIGETGTDLYWNTTFREQQEDAFVTQLKWAAELEIPVIIHARESLDWTIDLVEKNQDGRLTGVFHCFDGSSGQMERIIDLGFYLGIGGVSTYKKSIFKTYAQRVPTDRILLETDAPYLAPVPFRGKRNESSYMIHTAQNLALLLNTSTEELAITTSQNALQLFSIPGLQHI